MNARREHHTIAYGSSGWHEAKPGSGTAVFVRVPDRLTVSYDARGRVLAAELNGAEIPGPQLRAKVSDILYNNSTPAIPPGESMADEAQPPRPPRLLITGSRTLTDRKAVKDALKAWWETTGRNPDAVLVSGACPKGADRICEEIWERNGLTVERHPANWRPDGVFRKRAGYDRNEAMVDTEPDHCIAFIRAKSGGASHCARYARTKGIEVTLIEAD